MLAGSAALLAVALFAVDLTPRVESDFFFATDDPQLQASQEIERLFPSRPQVLLDAAGPSEKSEDTQGANDEEGPAIRSPAYIERIGALTEALAALDGVAAVRSLTSGPAQPADAFASPVWNRLLVAPDGSSTSLLVELEEDASQPAVVAGIEEVMDRFEGPEGETELSLAASGVPWVVEQIRRRLSRDLRVFSLTALVVFGALILLLYRDPWIALGTLTSCLAACAATLLLLRAVGVPIGVLTANLATLVFVLTLSHCIYLTASHQRRMQKALEEKGDLDPVRVRAATVDALTLTAVPSFWCMVTTLLGFVSLRFASARPLQELGTAGAVGTLVAFVLAYLLYPAFLQRHRGASPGESSGAANPNPSSGLASSHRLTGWITAGLALAVLIAAFGLPRLDTDPSLPAYFQPGGAIRLGIERIDRAGGSSPLTLLYRDADGARLDADPVLERLTRVQRALEADPATGGVLSLPLLIQEARRNPMAAFMPPPNLLDLLSTEGFGRVAASFVTEDRQQGVALLRMREQGRPPGEDRDEVVARLSRHFETEGFEVELAGGLYPLQGALSELVRSSIGSGLTGLGLLFLGIGIAVSRSARVTAAMLVCLAGTPIFLYGVLGLLRMPLDLISSPAANVAIAMGIDSMIHLVFAVRRRGDGADLGSARASWQEWAEARRRMWKPITGSALLLAAGFGIFGLSSFPPTQRFGLGVLLGIAIAAALTLTVLPWLSARKTTDP